MYKRIKAMDQVDEYEEIMEELQDRFGDLPIETERLLRIARMKIWGLEMGVSSIKEKQKVISILLSEEGSAKVDGSKIVSETMKFERAVGFGMDSMQLILTIDERKCIKYHHFDILEEIMQIIANSKKICEKRLNLLTNWQVQPYCMKRQIFIKKINVGFIILFVHFCIDCLKKNHTIVEEKF